ncbi:MAG: hypothetical protein SGBAC_011084 [Bacillariaceae sp.]
MLTSCLYHGWMHRPSFVLTRWKRDTIPSDIVSGAIIAAVVIISFLSLMSFADFLRVHWQQGPRRRPGLGEEEEVDGNGADIPEDENRIDETIVEIARTHGLAREAMHRGDGDDNDRVQQIETPLEHEDSIENELAILDDVHLKADKDDDDEGYPPDLDYDDIINNPPRVRDLVEDNIFRLVNEMDERMDAPGIEEEDQEPDMWPQEDGPQQDAFAQVDPAVLQDDQVDMEINVALDELLGLRGPFSTLIRNLLWLLAFNATYLGIFSFVPKAVGSTVYSGLFNNTVCDNILKTIPYVYSENENATTLSYIIRELNEESTDKETTFRLPDIVTVTLGYFSIAAVVVMFRYFWMFMLQLQQKRPREETAPLQPPADVGDARHGWHGAQRDEVDENGTTLEVALDATVAVVKVGVLLFLKMFLLPLSLGLCLDMSTMPLFGHSLARRIEFAGADIFSFILLHWVAGITFMLLVTVFLLQLREVAHPELLAGVIRPQEPQPDLLGNLMHETVLTHMKRMFLSLGIYAPLLTLHVYVPVRMIHWIGLTDSLTFYHLNFWHIAMPQLQIPIELVIFHLSMLALLERYKNSIGGWQHAWMVFMCKHMGLTEYMLPRAVDQFQLVGTKRVFLSNELDIKVDPFWYELASKEKNINFFVESNIEMADATQDVLFGDSKANGSRVLDSSLGFIKMPETVTPDGLDTNCLLPAKRGSYCLKQSAIGSSTSVRIEFWKEIPGDTIPRPPDGWDDLGAGGAYVQGRWAWGKEKKSVVEGSVAQRKPFRVSEHHRRPLSLMLKVVAFFIFSWIAITCTVFGLITAPLAVGRSFYYLFRIPEKYIHDPFAFVIGAFVFFPCMSIVVNGMKKAEGNPITTFRKWFSKLYLPPLRKISVILESALLWAAVAPFALGLTYELVAVKSSKWFMMEGPLIDTKTAVMSWLLGFVALNIWAFESYNNFFTEDFWANFWNAIVEPADDNAAREARDNVNAGIGASGKGSWQGKNGRVAQFFNVWRSVVVDWEWEDVDRVVLLDDFSRPIARQVASALVGSTICWQIVVQIAPSILQVGNGGFLLPLFGQVEYGIFRMVIFRLCAVGHVGVQLCTAHRRRIEQWFGVAHDAARDDRYLVGEILMDYDPSYDNN